MNIEAPITLCVTDEVKPLEFTIAYQNGDDFVVRYEGEIDDLTDSFVATGIIRQIYLSGGKTYLVVNKQDIDKFMPYLEENDWDYDVSG
jgi:archaeosine-15-forming tRNA-guanine transglycosylase